MQDGNKTIEVQSAASYWNDDETVQNIACIAWSKDGSVLAIGHSDRVSLCEIESKTTVAVRVRSQDADDNGAKLRVDGVRWLTANSILVTSTLIEGAFTFDNTSVNR